MNAPVKPAKVAMNGVDVPTLLATIGVVVHVIHVVADRITDLSGELAWLDDDGPSDSSGVESLARCDEVRRPVMDNRSVRKPGALAARKLRAEQPPQAVPVQGEGPPLLADPARTAVQVMPKGRNFR